MKVVILAGGYGTRISEETYLKPKPMIEIGDKPLLWHVMKIYSHYGYQDFIICLGYKGNVIKEYFAHYYLYGSDVTIDFGHSNTNEITVHNRYLDPWKVTLVDTGQDTMTGGRIKRIQKYVGDEAFMLTYGDGLSDIDIGELVKFHDAHGKQATVTATQPTGRFGALQLTDKQQVLGFQEKPQGDGGWVNGGFFMLEPTIFNLIEKDCTVWEREPLEELAKSGELMAFKHHGFWHPMDTLRDKNYLEDLWKSGKGYWNKG
ncbi:glucose-1-phosphate cytidylyltransferase [Paenibacillus crassostreae]|uniref:Glucose-1-phosphate cytidylyltransferase n=1 Tax=Paenibacillus crassostreae TaxID=1763538 RepID=A0A167GMB9_9BACL|nr:glucose-1-phosphate cytidylyltransferase [Paenibacillus crassostreae]AOZ92248.1 glucose-1-phosphate cytidylyltransferase [Paenibacillus crassostreae]OAB77711.1 glucose-1-phosphate cytidylyltransferase [Paenibacillus crassostreae]